MHNFQFFYPHSANSSGCYLRMNKVWLFIPQICVWLLMSPSPLPLSRWPRRARTSRSPASCPSDDATLRCLWWSGASCRRMQTDPRMNSSSPGSTWGRPAFMATTPRVSRGPKWSWRWWSRGRCLTCSSWMCPRGTGASTSAGCRSLRSTRTVGRPLQTALQPPSSAVSSGSIVLPLSVVLCIYICMFGAAGVRLPSEYSVLHPSDGNNCMRSNSTQNIKAMLSLVSFLQAVTSVWRKYSILNWFIIICFCPVEAQDTVDQWTNYRLTWVTAYLGKTFTLHKK